MARATPTKTPAAPLWCAGLLLAMVGFTLLAGMLTPPVAGVEGLRGGAERWGQMYGIDPNLILAVAAIESGGDPRARSRVGARGVMQLMPATAREMAGRVQLTDFKESQLDNPDLNLRLGTYYLSWLSDRFGRNRPVTILAAYNAGYGTVSRWLAELNRVDGAPPSDQSLLERIDYAETKAYVKRVLEAWRLLDARQRGS